MRFTVPEEGAAARAVAPESTGGLAATLRWIAVGLVVLAVAGAYPLFRAEEHHRIASIVPWLLTGILLCCFALFLVALRLSRIERHRAQLLQEQFRVQQDLSLALGAAKMVGFQCDLSTGRVRRFSGAGAHGRLITQGTGTYDEYLQSIHPEDRTRFDRHLRQLMTEGRREYEQQYRLGWADGRITWVVDKGEIRYDKQGRALELVGIAHDVTETVAARNALDESEQRFKRIAESMPQIVFVTGRDGRIEYVNARWREYTGLESADREAYAHLVPAQDRDAISAAWQKARERVEPFSAEFRLRGLDGTYRWFLTRAVPVRDHNDELVRWCGTSTDIDAQKRAAEELRLVTDQAEVLLLHCDRNLRFVFANRAYAARLGVSPDALIGKYVPEVLGPRAYGAIEAHLQQVLRGESVTFECMIPYENLGEKFMQGRCVPDIDPATREVKGLVAVLTDLTSRRELEEQLREADRRKDEFLAILGHELRNPLAPIRYATGLLKPGVPEQIVTAAQSVIERQVTHMARLIDDLLDVSRITRNTLELRMEFVDVRSVVNNVVETVRPLLESVRHKLTVSIPPSAVHARADVTRLSQVIGNVLNNAAKYTEPGGQIQLTLDTSGGSARIRIRDNGIGIDSALQARMFELFVQGDQTQTRASGGLGVGLAVARRLIEMHGGAIEVHSRGRGRGSEFTITLPLSQNVPASHDPAVLENVAPIFHRRQQLLIVDDNLDAANSLATLLQLSGYVTHIANDGLAAIEMADLIRPEAIIMDLGMPRMTGHEAARWVRQQPWGSQTVLIAVTGWGQEEDRRRSREAGFDVHLTKPVDSTTLLHELQQRSIRASDHETSERAS